MLQALGPKAFLVMTRSGVAVLGLAMTLVLSAPAVQAQVSFLSPSYYNSGIRPQSIAIGDLDGDGDNDLITASYMGYLIVKKNDGGTFPTSQTLDPTQGYSYSTTSVTVGDLDGDGDLDLVTSNSDGLVSVLKNNGTGTFAAARDFAVENSPIDVTVGDVDGDGDLDLITANPYADNVSVLKNNGDGTFATAQNFAVGDRPTSIRVGDLDKDGDLDLATANSGFADVSVLKNNGDGTFDTSQFFEGSGSSIAVGDLDNDGDLDLATNNVSVLKNNGDGTFAAPEYFAGGGSSLTIGDLDGDGDLDLATAFSDSGNSSLVSVIRNNGQGTFAAPQIFGLRDTAQDLTVGDLDNDGDLDLAVANGLYSGFAAVLQNTTPTLQLSLSPNRSNPIPLAGQTLSGPVYIFATGKDTDFLRVRFFIDDPDKSGQSFRLEQVAPFDLSGTSGSAANPFNTLTLTNGTHTITATFARTDGTYRTVNSTFTVGN